MIVSDSDAVARLNSPLNLINKLKSSSAKQPAKQAMELFTGPLRKVNSLPIELPAKDEPNLDTILANNESQIKLGLAHDKSLNLLARAVDMLDAKLDDVNATKLPAVVIAASKVVESIRRERLESSKNAKDREVHYHFYTPQQKVVEDYEVIEVA
jgi:hypothetical protein